MRLNLSGKNTRNGFSMGGPMIHPKAPEDKKGMPICKDQHMPVSRGFYFEEGKANGKASSFSVS